MKGNVHEQCSILLPTTPWGLDATVLTACAKRCCAFCEKSRHASSTMYNYTLSAFWLWSSVVSVLISVTTDMSPTGDLLVTYIFRWEILLVACPSTLMCRTGMAQSRWQHTLRGNNLADQLPWESVCASVLCCVFGALPAFCNRSYRATIGTKLWIGIDH